MSTLWTLWLFSGILLSWCPESTSFRLALNATEQIRKLGARNSTSLRELEEKKKVFLDTFMKQLLPLAVGISKEARISPVCSEALVHVVRGIRDLDTWAISLLDASGRTPPGLFEGTSSDFGDFDECLAVSVSEEETAKGRSDGMAFKGKYCLIGLQVSTLLQDLPAERHRDKSEIVKQLMSTKTVYGRLLHLRDTSKYFAGKLGICVPSVCDEGDIRKGLNLIANALELSPEVDSCQVKTEYNWKPDQIAILSLFIVLAMLIGAGTVWDVLCRLDHYQTTSSYNLCKTTKKHAGATKFLLPFSLYSNIQAVFRVPSSGHADPLGSLRGMRFLSILWIILAHTYFFPIIPFFFRLSNLSNYKVFRAEFLYGFINNASLSVDTFFLISGFLVTFSMGRKVTKTRSLGLDLYLLRRLLRVLPAMLVTIALFLMFPLLGDGPQWQAFILDKVEVCRTSWWKNALFIQNFWHIEDNCLFHTWFLAVVMQFCVLTMPLLWLLFRKPRIGVSATLAVMLLCSVATACVTGLYDLPPTVALTVFDSESWDSILSYVYIRPYTHAGPYCIGLLLGYMMSTRKLPICPNKVQQTTGWVVSSGVMLMSMYGLYTFPFEGQVYKYMSALYSAFNRTLWAAAVAWVIFACCSGRGGIVNRILCWGGFVPLDRLVYFAYLLHPLIMFFYHGRARTRLFYGHPEMIIHYFGFTVSAFILAFFCHVIVELPVGSLDTAMFPRKPAVNPNNISQEDSLEGKENAVFRDDQDNVVKKDAQAKPEKA